MGTDQNVKKIHFWDGANRKILRKGPSKNKKERIAMNILEETKYIMNEYDVHPNKRLGQNFLFDEPSLQTIASEVTNEDTVIEIGPGLGTLTAILAEKAKKVIAVEIDSKMVQILQERFKLYNNVEIIQDDILHVDIDKIAPQAKIVANLPYYITTSIITKLLNTNIKDITVLIQKEVAERICAEPGTKKAGAITYFVKYYADSKIVANVPRECFIPSPEVESAVVKITKRDEKAVKVDNEKLFFEIIKTNFTQRRKTILNSLSGIIDKEMLKNILKECKIEEAARGENLSLEDFAKITNLFEKMKNANN